MSDEPNDVIRNVKEMSHRIAKDFFKDYPLNKFSRDSYDDLISNGLKAIFDRAKFAYESGRTGNAYKGYVTFDNVFVLPPFKSAHLGKQRNIDPRQLGFREDNIGIKDDIKARLLKLKDDWLLPRDCRDNMKSYMLSVYADVTITQTTTPSASTYGIPSPMSEEYDEDIANLNDVILEPLIVNVPVKKHVEQFVKMFDIPLMTGSEWDWIVLSGTTKENYSEFTECVFDPFSSFIINGKDKVFVTQEKQAPNISRCISINKPDVKYDLVAEFRSESLEKRSVQIKLVFYTPDKKNKRQKVCAIQLPFLGGDKPKKEQEFNVMNVYRFYIIWALSNMGAREENLTSIQILRREFANYLFNCSSAVEIRNNPSFYFVNSELVDTMIDAQKFSDDKEFIKQIAIKLGFYTETKDSVFTDDIYYDVIDRVKLLFDAELFPHINIFPDDDFVIREQDEWVPFPKLYTLSCMIIQFVKCYGEKKAVTDRDSFNTKLLATIGIELGTLIEKAFKQAIWPLRKKLRETGFDTNIQVATLLTTGGNNKVTSQISSSFSSGNWGLNTAGKKRTGVVLQHDRTSILSQWAVIRKLSIPVNSKSKIVKARLVPGTGYGIIDPTNTPDSDKAGLIKELAISVQISINDKSSEEYAQQFASLLKGIDYYYEGTVTQNGNIITGYNVDWKDIMTNEGIIYIEVDGNTIVRTINKKINNTTLEVEESGNINVKSNYSLEYNTGEPELFDYKIPSEDGRPAANIPLFINYIWKGFATPEVLRRFKEEKRSLRLGYMTEVYESIEEDDLETVREYHVVTTAGRAMRPVFSIGPNNEFYALDHPLTKDYFNGNFTKEVSFNELLREGLVEFVSSNETEFGETAIDYEQFVLESSSRNFDYMEIDPVYMLSIETATQPSAPTNPVPRVMYYGLMSRQPISIPLTTFLHRHETDMKILNYTQKPLISTDMIDVVGLNESGFGQNVTVFVMSYGATDEDATVWKKEFFERGGFNSTLFETYTTKAYGFGSEPNDDLSKFSNGVVTVKRRLNPEEYIEESPTEAAIGSMIPTIEEEDEDIVDDSDISDEEKDEEAQTVADESLRPFGYNIPLLHEKYIPSRFQEEEGPPIYTRISMHKGGITGVGTAGPTVMVRPKDTLMRYTNTMGADSDMKEVALKGSMTGFVHSTHRTQVGPEIIQKVVVRFPHIPGQGDKFASRYAQKGVIGNVIPEIDLPFTLDGKTPDVIFSPTSFGSRMTVGLFIEMFRGKAAATCNLNNFIKRMVTLKPGWLKPTINKDFYIPLTEIMVLINLSNNDKQQYKEVEEIRKEVLIDTLTRLNYNYPDRYELDELDIPIQQQFQQLFDETIYKMRLTYKRTYGIKFTETHKNNNGKIIGRKHIYYTLNDLSYTATLKTGEKAILFSQLPVKLQFNYYAQHLDEIVPRYRLANPEARKAGQRFSEKEKSTLEQKIRDATPFREISAEEIGQLLLEKGYTSHGKQIVINGITGKKSTAQVFTGPCYYMALKHLVDKKQQARDQGNNSLSTRAPIKGKDMGGAVKKEEMQRVAALAHGANKFLREAFLTAADEYDAIACRRCGKFCYKDANTGGVKFICNQCGVNVDPYKVQVPWSFMKIHAIIKATGGDIILRIKPSREEDRLDEELNRPLQSTGIYIEPPVVYYDDELKDEEQMKEIEKDKEEIE